MPFDGLRVLSLESRRSSEIEVLIRKRGGDPFVAPSMRETPLEYNEAAFTFAESLFAGRFDMMILLTGVGTRMLHKTLSSRYGQDRFPDALRRLTVVARGPKPAAACREMQVPVTVLVPEPNTWRELLRAVEGRPERKAAVQEYGRSNEELIEGLHGLGIEVTTVPVYQWDLPDDVGPLEEACRKLASRKIDVALFTTSAQVAHLFRIAEQMGLAGDVRSGLEKTVIASIGPTTTEALEEFGLRADYEPTHPKMGILVQEISDRARQLLERKFA